MAPARSRWRLLRAFVAIYCGSLAALVLVGALAPVPAWATPHSGLTSAGSRVALPILDAVACSTTTSCVAVGLDSVTGSATYGQGMVVPITNGIPGSPQAIAGTTELSAVSCTPSNTCVAVGDNVVANQGTRAVVVAISGGTAGAAHLAVGVQYLLSVACLTTTSCEAFGESSPTASSYPGPVMVPIVNGTPGAAQSLAVGISAITCPTANTCLTVGSGSTQTGRFDATVTVIIDGTPGPVQTVTAPGGADLSAVACFSTAVCVAVGESRDTPVSPLVVPITNLTAGAAQIAPEESGFSNYTSVACATATTCVAVGQGSGAGFWGAGLMTTITGGVAGPPQEFPGPIGGVFKGVACPTARSCIGVGSTATSTGAGGEVIVITPGFVYPSSTFTYPLDGQTSIDTAKPFTWTTFPQAQAFQLDIGTTPQGWDLVNSGPLPAAQSSYSVPALPVGKTLYATLLVSGDGFWVVGPTTTFTAAPRPLGFIFPLTAQIGVDPTKSFSWTPNPQAQAYYLLVGTTIYYGNLVNSGALSPSQTTYQTPILPANSTLYATLFTKINGTWTHFVEATFTTGPARATIVVPYDGDSTLDGAPLFMWTTIAAAEYRLFTIGTTPYAWDVDNSGVLPPSTHSLQALNLPAFQTLYATIYTRVNGIWAKQAVSFSVG